MNEDGAETLESRLCESLAAVLGLEKGKVEGGTRLEEALPRERRAELWGAWSRRAGVRFPPLDHTMTVKMSWFAGGFLAALVGISALRLVKVYVPGSTMAGGVLGLLLGAVGLRFLGGQGLEFPLGVATVEQLALRLGRRED